MPVKKHIDVPGGVPVDIWTDDVDEKSIVQLTNIAKLPFTFDHVAAMPDVHVGIGATVGSVIATVGAVIPAAVGVDIGCGMLAVKTNIDMPEDDPERLKALMASILRRVPVGLKQRNDKNIRRDLVERFTPGLETILADDPTALSGMRYLNWQNEIGTLGGGNHFIEFSRDETGAMWVMLHTGSRGPGNVLANYFIKMAKTSATQAGLDLPDDNLAFFEEGTPVFNRYMRAVSWAQDYALENRRAIAEDVLRTLQDFWPDAIYVGEVINCHHNYVTLESHFGQEVWVTRKGAISAKAGEAGIIPGSMGSESFLVEGLGNPAAFMSSSHGAGRKLSRTAAREAFNIEDLERQTQGVVCRKDQGVIDEIPSAYKDIHDVIDAQSDLTQIKHTLKQCLCVKG
ncbi:MAG TPA: RNA-splicing ligase RtcB [Sutterella sp.]|nr:RNA-splicing ligase RtcB [Sutterella sp.]